MLTSEITKESYGAVHTLIPPALDLEELLEKRNWEPKDQLSEYEKRILNQGLSFLELALKGQEIGMGTVNNGDLVMDLSAIKAYLLSNRAYRFYQNLLPYKLSHVLFIVKTVLATLLEIPDTIEQLPCEKDIEIARKFFLALSKISPI